MALGLLEFRERQRVDSVSKIMCEIEVAVIARLQKRDDTALAIVYDSYGKLAYSLILRMVKNTEIAEDLVQETFLRVWTGVGGFDAERGAFGGWLLAIARNRALDYLRSSRDRRTVNSLTFREIEDPKLFADLERTIWISGNTKALSESLDKLSANQREVLDLAYFGGYTQTEIAKKVGYPLGTVKTWIRRALNVLREDLLGNPAASTALAGFSARDEKRPSAAHLTDYIHLG